MHYRSIDIGLHSQFDIETLPEYQPGPKDHYVARGIAGFIPELVDDKTSTCSVYVPILPGSTFWIGYSVSPPVPDGYFFLFKLYINGAHIVSWSTDKEEGWQGKTMFGLFESPEDENDKKRIEKRMLCFTPPNRNNQAWRDVADVFDETACVEIRVHRANGRRRVERQAKEYENTLHAKNGKGIRQALAHEAATEYTNASSLAYAGRAGPEQPKRFYKFALIDPVDQPFATFRYYYRTWDQLRDLGLLEQHHTGAGEENDLSVIEPPDGSVYETGVAEVSCSSTSKASEDIFQDCSEAANDKNSCNGTEENALSKRLKTANPSSGATRPTSVETRRPSSSTRGISLRRVSNSSEPPSVKLDTTKPASRRLPTNPQKRNSQSSISYCPHPAYTVEDWTVRTLSPVKSVKEGTSTPPLEKRRERGRSAAALISVIASVWRRRGTPTPDGTASTDGREGAQSLR
jgi:hypothetical protein